jgi:hypothetical protein
MKNRILFLLILTTVSLPVFSQTDDVYKTIAKETCECLAKKNYDYATAGKAEVQMTLGLCMMESAQRNKLTMDIGNTQAMTELGQKVGLQMAPLCPEVFKAFLNTEEQAEEPMEEEDDTEYFTLSGKVKSIEEKDFLYVTLKEASGKEHKFIWLYYFEGSDDFKDDPKKLVGKDVSITYILLEVFQPKSKVYYNLNIISGLEMN